MTKAQFRQIRQDLRDAKDKAIEKNATYLIEKRLQIIKDKTSDLQKVEEEVKNRENATANADEEERLKEKEQNRANKAARTATVTKNVVIFGFAGAALGGAVVFGAKHAVGCCK